MIWSDTRQSESVNRQFWWNFKSIIWYTVFVEVFGTYFCLPTIVHLEGVKSYFLKYLENCLHSWIHPLKTHNFAIWPFCLYRTVFEILKELFYRHPSLRAAFNPSGRWAVKKMTCQVFSRGVYHTKVLSQSSVDTSELPLVSRKGKMCQNIHHLYNLKKKSLHLFVQS